MLCNQNIKKHHSALQFQNAVRAHLTKVNIKQSHGAILGPVKNFGQHPEHSFGHCSPVLTRPKDQGKWRAILDLSYSKGFALNDQVDQ